MAVRRNWRKQLLRVKVATRKLAKCSGMLFMSIWTLWQKSMLKNNAKQLKTLFKEIMMTKTFSELRKINVNEHIEKKGNLSYLSWAWAVDYLLQEDSTATWYFDDPKCFGETVMVSCTVAAMGKQMTMHLPVMDNKNNAVKNPDARKISDAMMRCLAKCIACFGIGLYVYAGEDVPSQDIEPLDVDAMLQAIAGAETLEQLKEIYISTIKTAKGNQPAMRELELAKDARKVELQKVAE